MVKDSAMCMLMGIADMKVGQRCTMAVADMAEGDEPHNSLDRNTPYKFMKHLHWQTMTLRSVTFGVFFPKETRCES